MNGWISFCSGQVQSLVIKSLLKDAFIPLFRFDFQTTTQERVNNVTVVSANEVFLSHH